MNLMKKTALIVWAVAWLITQAAKDLIVFFVDVMRYALGEEGRPVSILTFLLCMAALVVMFGFTGVLMAALRVN